MTVRSEPLTDGQPWTKDSAVVSRATLQRQRGSIERGSAWVVLVLSAIGSIVAFHGGWGPVLALQLTLVGVGGGVLSQVVLTYLEWYYFDNRLVSWTARAFDTLLTALGYGPLVLALLVTRLGAHGVPSALYVAWGIIGLVSLAIAWYPESRLVD